LTLEKQHILINLKKIVDAFVALGGNSDATGKVSKQSMLKIIKEEFDLTFDMEKIMERIEASSEELDYQTFCMLFDTQDENRNRRNSRTSTMLSVKKKYCEIAMDVLLLLLFTEFLTNFLNEIPLANQLEIKKKCKVSSIGENQISRFREILLRKWRIMNKIERRKRKKWNRNNHK